MYARPWQCPQPLCKFMRPDIIKNIHYCQAMWITYIGKSSFEPSELFSSGNPAVLYTGRQVKEFVAPLTVLHFTLHKCVSAFYGNWCFPTWYCNPEVMRAGQQFHCHCCQELPIPRAQFSEFSIDSQLSFPDFFLPWIIIRRLRLFKKQYIYVYIYSAPVCAFPPPVYKTESRFI